MYNVRMLRAKINFFVFQDPWSQNLIQKRECGIGLPRQVIAGTRFLMTVVTLDLKPFPSTEMITFRHITVPNFI